MGYKCPACHSDFGTDKARWAAHTASCQDGLAKAIVSMVTEAEADAPPHQPEETELPGHAPLTYTEAIGLGSYTKVYVTYKDNPQKKGWRILDWVTERTIQFDGQPYTYMDGYGYDWWMHLAEPSGDAPV